MVTTTAFKENIIHPPYIPSYPYHLVWIATNACNARCLHCSTAATKRLPNELTTGEVKNLFKKLSELGIFDIAISGGEPFVRSDIMEIIEYLTQLGFKIGIGTNGSTINRQQLKDLKKLNVSRLQVSIDGTKELHDIARRWQGLFDKAKQTIYMANEIGLNVHVCMTLHKLNYKVMREVIELCISWNVKRFNLSRFIPTGRGDLSLDLSKEQWKEVMYAYEAMRKEFSSKMEMTTHLSQSALLNPDLNCHSGFIGCQAGIGQGCIGATGDVTPCVMLPITIGNIKENSFKSLWDTAPLIQSFKARDQLKGACGSCKFKNKCGGCRAVAYSYTGDVFETDSRCWLVN
jgi:radical SAM protein with 4Fe4S-binding SPASM domain